MIIQKFVLLFSHLTWLSNIKKPRFNGDILTLLQSPWNTIILIFFVKPIYLTNSRADNITVIKPRRYSTPTRYQCFLNINQTGHGHSFNSYYSYKLQLYRRISQVRMYETSRTESKDIPAKYSLYQKDHLSSRLAKKRWNKILRIFKLVVKSLIAIEFI